MGKQENTMKTGSGTTVNLSRALGQAVAAAERVGSLMRQHLHQEKKTNEISKHDIKLELDVRCQKLIERDLRAHWPQVSVLGEEGITGDPQAPLRWVVDPIDGTVNFNYGIPHASVSIALQQHSPDAPGAYEDGYSTVIGVVHDPFCREMWTAVRGKPARCNGRIVRVSDHARLADSIVAIGFSKTRKNLEQTMPYMARLVHRVRKVRIMGSAALSLVYVAGGRFDAYIERGLRLWDVAAGGLIVESAGGEFWREPIEGDYAYRMICTNGKLRRKLAVPGMGQGGSRAERKRA
jgi:myo-inositol-1(or 4)-monophosphatase